jgi:hypothetical protein
MEQLGVVLFLAAANTKLVGALKAPVQKRFPAADLWWMVYVAAATGIGLVWLAQVNLFGQWIANDVAGRLLTGLVAGLGSSFVYDVLLDKPASITVKAEPGGSVMAAGVEAAPEGDLPARMLG